MNSVYDDEFDIFSQIEDARHGRVTEDKPIVKHTGECAHLNVKQEYGICECLDCGVEIKTGVSNESKMYTSVDNRSMGDGNRCWAPKKKNKNIRDDLKGLGIPDIVINEAYAIFKMVTEGRIFRSDKRASIIVACLMEAYKILKIPMSLETLLEKIPIPNVTSGMKIVETKIKQYDTERTRVTHTSPVDSIRDIMAGWDDSKDSLDCVLDLYKKIEDKSSMLNRSRAKSVAAAVIYYYALATKRTNITLKAFSKRVALSESTISKNAKEISAILQTPNVLAY